MLTWQSNTHADHMTIHMTVAACFAQVPIGSHQDALVMMHEEPAPVIALSGEHSPGLEHHSFVSLFTCSSVAC